MLLKIVSKRVKRAGATGLGVAAMTVLSGSLGKLNAATVTDADILRRRNIERVYCRTGDSVPDASQTNRTVNGGGSHSGGFYPNGMNGNIK